MFDFCIHSPFIINSNDLSPAIFVLLVALVTSTLNLGVLSNNTLNRINELYKFIDPNWGDTPNVENQLSFCCMLRFAFLEVAYLFSILKNNEIEIKISSPEKRNSPNNNDRKLSYEKSYLRWLYSVMFLQLLLVMIIFIRILLFSFLLSTSSWLCWLDIMIVFGAFSVLCIFWLVVLLKITYGSNKTA